MVKRGVALRSVERDRDQFYARRCAAQQRQIAAWPAERGRKQAQHRLVGGAVGGRGGDAQQNGAGIDPYLVAPRAGRHAHLDPAGRPRQCDERLG